MASKNKNHGAQKSALAIVRLFADLSLEGIDAVSYHLAMANKDYREERWGSCTVNCQKLVEAITPNKARQYLEKGRLLNSSEKQWLSATRNLLSRLARASHSVDKHQAKLARTVSFAMAEFLLYRLQSSIDRKV